MFERVFSTTVPMHAREVMAAVGDQLLAALAARNLTHRLTRDQLCERVGLRRSELDAALAGSADLSLSDLAGLAESLGAELKVEIRLPGRE